MKNKGLLRQRLETVFRNTEMNKKLFQKVYYNPGLLVEDELELRKAFVSENSAHDTKSTVINWTTFLTFWPALYFTSTKFKGWGVVCSVSFAWYVIYRQFHRFNNNMLQGNLDSFASPYVEKYKIHNHHE